MQVRIEKIKAHVFSGLTARSRNTTAAKRMNNEDSLFERTWFECNKNALNSMAKTQLALG